MSFELLKGIDEEVFDYEVLHNCAFLQIEFGFRGCLSMFLRRQTFFLTVAKY